jgi:hypothetical protein
MAGISITDTFDALLTTTLRNYSRKLRDNIFNGMPFLKWLTSKNRINLQDGGYQIVEHLLYGKNSTMKSYSGYDVLDTTPQDGVTAAYFNWKEYGGTIAISRRERRQNAGKHQLLNLLKVKIQQAELSMKDKISEDIFANLSSEPTTAITPLVLHVSNTPSTTTVGGVSGATYTWWRNHQQSVGAYGSNLENYLRTGFNTCSAGGASYPDAILCTQTAYEYYESLAASGKRFVNEARTADLGFEVLQYRGADMFWDGGWASNVPATGESIALLNSENIELIVDSQSNFVTTEFIEPENQTAQVAKVLAMMNLCINNRRKLGLLHGISAS